ncbi:HSP20 family protein [Ruminococcaceae bacterium FB2012]|nr:HSP20 family protein [Ruminococcaceae bacterium FB2012]
MYAMTPFEKRNYDLFDMFDDFGRGFFAPSEERHHIRTDIRDEGDKFIMEAELPGFKKEDISIDLTDEMLTLSAEHKTESDEKDKNGKYIRRERSYGSYKRSFDLSGIDSAAVTAEYKSGILTLTLPKKQIEAPKSRRLEIAETD